MPKAIASETVETVEIVETETETVETLPVDDTLPLYGSDRLVSIDNQPIADISTEERNIYIRNLLTTNSLINTKGIAELANVSSASVVNWQTKLSSKEVAFPTPLPVVGNSKIWFTSEVQEWLSNRGDKESRKREARIASLMAELEALKN